MNDNCNGRIENIGYSGVQLHESADISRNLYECLRFRIFLLSQGVKFIYFGYALLKLQYQAKSSQSKFPYTRS